MKVALIHNALNNRGGSQRYVLEIARTLEHLGVEVTLFAYEYCPELCYPELAKGLSIQFVNQLAGGGASATAAGARSKVKAWVKSFILRRLLYSVGGDYLFSVWSDRRSAFRLSKMMNDAGGNFDVVFAHEEPISVWAAIHYKNITGTPVYWFCYDTIVKWYLHWEAKRWGHSVRSWLLKTLYFRYDKSLVCSGVDKIAVLDENMRQRVASLYGLNACIRRGAVSPDSIGIRGEGRLRKLRGISEGSVVILTVSRFVAYRRIHDLLAAYAALPEDVRRKCFLYINAPITDQEYYDHCMTTYQDVVENPRVLIDTSYARNDEELFDFYSSSDIFVFPNEMQTWGHAPLEAVAAGAVAIVSDGCGIKEVFNETTPELVFEVGNVEALSGQIVKLIEGNVIEEYANKQRSYVAENLTWESICKGYLEDFKKLATAKDF